jgi:hypothetical protein
MQLFEEGRAIMSYNRPPAYSNDGMLSKALQVIESLLHGTDPTTGEELPSDSVLNRVDVNRALLVATTAIRLMADRAARRAQLPSGIGRAWSPEEEQTLRDEFKGDLSLQEIANRHQRTVRAIEARLERLGLITSDQRITTSSFGPSAARKPRKSDQRE